MKRFMGLLAYLAALAISAPAFAAPAAYVTGPTGTYTEAVNDAIANVNAVLPGSQTTATCTGTTTATCQGIRIAASYTGLTTAAGVTSTAQTVTNASVSASSQIFCQVNGYAGTGNPVALNIVPGAGSFTYQIENTHASAALNATVVTVCTVNN